MTDLAPAGRRRRLDRETIVDALLEVGVDQFSMHAVARHLGVSTTALYRYFSSRQELLDAAMDVFCERLDAPDPELPWVEYLRRLAHSFRKTLLAMPGAADYANAIGPATPSAFEVVEGALSVLRRAGFEPQRAWWVYSFVVNHAFRSVKGQEHFNELTERNGPGGFRVFQLTDAENERFPELARTVGALEFDFDASFATSLDWLLDGIAADHESR